METLLTTIYDEEETHSDDSIFNFFLTYVNVLEGIKTQIKNVHWASLKLPNSDKRGAHLYLDDFLEVVEDFQDLVAESAMGITGESFEFNTVKGVPFHASSTDELIKYIQNKTVEFYDAIPKETIYAGIKSETETFILNINQYVFRFKLTD
nr:MAG TPA: hypothetical protein [Crassvirales sp.]